MKKGRVSWGLAIVLMGVMGFTCGGPAGDEEATSPESATVSGVPIPPIPPPVDGNYVMPVDNCPPPEPPPGEFDNVVYLTASSTLAPYSVYVSAVEGTTVRIKEELVLACDDYRATVTYDSGVKILIKLIVNGAGEQFCKIEDGANIFNDAATYVKGKPSFAFCQLMTSR